MYPTQIFYLHVAISVCAPGTEIALFGRVRGRSVGASGKSTFTRRNSPEEYIHTPGQPPRLGLLNASRHT